MNADLTAIIAEVLGLHYNASHDYRGACSCGYKFEGWPAIRKHQAEQIAARLDAEPRAELLDQGDYWVIRTWWRGVIAGEYVAHKRALESQ